MGTIAEDFARTSMPRGDLRWYHITSLLVLPWAAAARLAGCASPFPLCLAALVFAVPYHVFVLGDPAGNVARSAAFHAAAVALAPFDVSWEAVALSAAFVIVHGSVTGFFEVYGCAIPMFHKDYPDSRDRFAILFGIS